MNYWKTCILFVLLGFVGCSNDNLNRAVVEGNITLDGQPLNKGIISFFPMNNEGPSVGAKIENGKYRFDKKNGPVVGEYRIEINGEQVPNGKKIPSPMDPTLMIDEMVDPVPEKYHSNGAMGKTVETLKATVTTGKNTIDFPLSSK
jgi:hypothetical protein